MQGLILERTVTGPKDCLQIVTFTSLLPMVCICQIELDETQHLAWPRQSKSLPIMGTEHQLFDSQVIRITRVDTEPKASVFS